MPERSFPIGDFSGKGRQPDALMSTYHTLLRQSRTHREALLQSRAFRLSECVKSAIRSRQMSIMAFMLNAILTEKYKNKKI